jgi:hypothetical protein
MIKMTAIVPSAERDQNLIKQLLDLCFFCVAGAGSSAVREKGFPYCQEELCSASLAASFAESVRSHSPFFLFT